MDDVELAGCGAAVMNQISKAHIHPGSIVIKEIRYHPLDQGLLKPHLTLQASIASGFIFTTGFSQTAHTCCLGSSRRNSSLQSECQAALDPLGDLLQL